MRRTNLALSFSILATIAGLVICNGALVQAANFPPPPESLAASGSPSMAMSEYVCRDGGFKVAYPSGWTIKEHVDKDNLFKINGDKDGSSAEIAASMNSEPGMTIDKLSYMLENFVFPKIEHFKKIQDKKVVFGTSRKIEGEVKDTALEFSGIAIKQRYVIFEHANKVITLVFTGTSAQFDKLIPMFNDVLLSVAPVGAGTIGGAHSSGMSAANAWQMKRFADKSVPVHFNYPDNWMPELKHDPDHPVEISGKDFEGHAGAVSVYCGDLNPNMGLDQAVQILEDRYMKPKPGFRQLKQENLSLGAGSRLDGVVHEATFEDHGVPATVRTVFFRDNGAIRSLMFTTVGWKDSEANNLFRKILATVECE